MHRPDSVEKMRESLRRIGHKPAQMGGNGRPASEAQAVLAKALGWPMEVIVLTRSVRGKVSPLPYHYKIDIADELTMTAIEVDGVSHQSRKVREADMRKETALRLLGWRVLRFSNEDVMQRLETCVQTATSTTSKST